MRQEPGSRRRRGRKVSIARSTSSRLSKTSASSRRRTQGLQVARARPSPQVNNPAPKTAPPPTSSTKGAARGIRTALIPYSSSKIAHDVARSFALPSVSETTRLKTEFTSTPTAATTLHYYLNQDNTSPPATIATNLIPNGGGLYAMSRDPLHCLWYTTHTPNAVAAYRWWTYDVSGPTQSFYFPGATLGGPSQSLLLDYATLLQGSALTDSPRHYSFQEFGMCFVYMQHGMVMQLNNPGLINLSPACMTMYTWTPEGPEEYYAIQLTAAATHFISPRVGTVGATEPGFYCWRFGGAATSAGNVSIDLIYQQNTQFLVSEHLPFLDTHVDNLSSLRVNGMSLMVTCRAADLYANGTMAGATIPNGGTVLSAIIPGIDPTTHVGSLSGAAVFKEKKGMYSYMPVATLETLEMRKMNAKRAGKFMPVARCGPAPPGGLVAIAYNSAATGATFPSNTFIVTQVLETEFITSNQWYAMLPPTMTNQDLVFAMELLAQVPQFHENPLHWSDIWNALKTAGSYALRVAPAVLTALGQPEAAGAVELVGGAVDAIGKLF